MWGRYRACGSFEIVVISLSVGIRVGIGSRGGGSGGST